MVGLCADSTQIFIIRYRCLLLMAKLPAWSWLAVGLLLAVGSWYAGMSLFFWLGWLFVIVGAAKFLIGYMLPGKEPGAPTGHDIRRHPSMHPVHVDRHQSRLGHYVHQYYRCSCGNPVRATDIFCSACGRRLR